MSIAYEEIVDFIASGPTPKNVVDFKPSEAAKARVADLIHRQKTVGITADEKDELEQFLQIEHLMRLAKAKARQRLGPG